jgi:hypothetical protein
LQKVLISLPDNLAKRMKVFIPQRQRSKIISELIEKEIKRREKSLYQCAREVEKDDALNREMEEWNVTVGDGIDDETW